jgi:hypothetical protein
MTEELSNTPPPMVGETSPLSPLEAEVPLFLILADLVIYFAI